MTELATYQPQTALAEQMEYAQVISSGAMLPVAYRGKPADILIATGLGQAIGIAPAQSLYEIYVVNGRPSPSANLMSALVRRAGHKLRIEGDATRCTATLVRADDPDFPFMATWTIDQARAAGLAGKDTWKQYPAAMLRARAIAEVVRMGASEAVLGMEYAKEEMQDVEDVAPAPSVKAPGLASLRAAVQPNTAEAAMGGATVTVQSSGAPTADIEQTQTNIEDAVEVETPTITKRQQGKLFALFAQKGIVEAEQKTGIEAIVGHAIEGRTSLTGEEFDAVIARLEALPDAAPDEEPIQ